MNITKKPYYLLFFALLNFISCSAHPDVTVIQAELPDSVVMEDKIKPVKPSPAIESLLKEMLVEKGNTSNLPALEGRPFGVKIKQPSGNEKTEQIAFINNDEHIITTSLSRKVPNVRKWNVKSGREISGLKIPNKAGTDSSVKSYIAEVILSDDANSLFVQHRGAELIRHWSIVDGSFLGEYGNGENAFSNVSFSQDNLKMLFSPFGGKSKLVHSDANIETLVGPDLQGSTDFKSYYKKFKNIIDEDGMPMMRKIGIASQAFSLDSTKLAIGYGDGTIRLFSSLSGEEIKSLKITRTPRSIAFSPDGTSIAIGTDQDLRFIRNKREKIAIEYKDHTSRILLLNINTGNEIFNIKSHKNPTQDLKFSSNGKFLVSASGYDPYIRVWDSKNGTELASFLAGYPGVETLAVSNDGTKIATKDEQYVLRIHDLSDGNPDENPELCAYTICED